MNQRISEHSESKMAGQESPVLCRPFPARTAGKEIFAVFSRLGLLGFGGPVATIAMMEEEACRKRKWVTPARFSEMYSVCKLLPGPVAAQMAIYLGLEKGGLRGGLLSGLLFILPSFFLVLLLSFFYLHSGATQQFSAVFLAMQSGALGVVLVSTIQLSEPYRKKAGAWLIALGSCAIVAASPGWEPLVILFWGLSGALSYTFGEKYKSRAHSWGGLLLFLLVLAGAGTGLWAQGETLLLQLFWVCFKAGAFVFGTGLAVVPILESDVVQKLNWLTHAEFMDGLALGQITPGPFVITATFIGYKTAGLWGALAATLGIFLPAFINILYIVPHLWKKISGSRAAKGFSAWAIPAVIGGIVGTSFSLGKHTLQSPFSLFIFLFVIGVSLGFKIPAWILVPVAGLIGAIASFI